MLLEVIDARFEEGLVEIAGDVLANVGTAALGVAHFAEDPSAGRGDAFNGMDGAVGIELGVHRRGSVEVGVLRGDLAYGRELLNVFFARVEFAFAVGEGDVVQVTDFGSGEPG